ncbi:hypothetical protein [Bacteroides nordii]|uniref:hypothetical protein n=1 Tax=Bacteroides nordii TaxID=291645 RepID=UPI002A7FA856|nr:hypothetical protein [Bacteroides nordii]
MSLIKHKSEENLEAAKILNNNRKFTSSVHCSYYAILQMMKYALSAKCDISYEKQNEMREKDSHIYIRDEVLYQLSNIKVKTSIKRTFDAAKALRKKADYLEAKIEDEDSIGLYEEAEALINKLKKEFVL